MAVSKLTRVHYLAYVDSMLGGSITVPYDSVSTEYLKKLARALTCDHAEMERLVREVNGLPAEVTA
jgi:transcription termination factor Rho